MNVAALCAQMSASVRSRSVGVCCASRWMDNAPRASSPWPISGVAWTARKPSSRASARRPGSTASISVSAMTVRSRVAQLMAQAPSIPLVCIRRATASGVNPVLAAMPSVPVAVSNSVSRPRRAPWKSASATRIICNCSDSVLVSSSRLLSSCRRCRSATCWPSSAWVRPSRSSTARRSVMSMQAPRRRTARSPDQTMCTRSISQRSRPSGNLSRTSRS